MENILLKILVCFIAGAGAGIGTGFAGMSAAAVIGPMLITFLGIPAYDAVGIGLISDDCLDQPAFRGAFFQLLPRFGNGLQKESQSDDNQCYLHRATHGLLGQKACHKAAYHRYDKNAHKQR